MGFEAAGVFLSKVTDLLEFLLPRYVEEGKNSLVIAVGCTGGMHRSVFIAQHIYKRLRAKGLNAKIEHRDLMKNEVWEHVIEEV